MPVDAPLFDIPFGVPVDLNVARAQLVNTHSTLQQVVKYLRDNAAECIEECLIGVTECRRCLMAAASKPLELAAGKLQKTRTALYQEAMNQLSNIGELVSYSRPIHGNPLGDTVHGSIGIGQDRVLLDTGVPTSADALGGQSDGTRPIQGSGGPWQVWSKLPPGSVIRICWIYQRGIAVNPPPEAYDGVLIGDNMTLPEATVLQARCPSPNVQPVRGGQPPPPYGGGGKPLKGTGLSANQFGASSPPTIGRGISQDGSTDAVLPDSPGTLVINRQAAPPLRDATGLAVAGQLGGINLQAANGQLKRAGLTFGNVAGMPAADARKLLINAGVNDPWTNFIINVVALPVNLPPISPPFPPFPPQPPLPEPEPTRPPVVEPPLPPAECPPCDVQPPCSPAIDLYDVYQSQEEDCYCIPSGHQPGDMADTLIASGVTAGACPQIIDLACGDDLGCKRIRQCDPPSLDYASVQTWQAGIESGSYRERAAKWMGSAYAVAGGHETVDAMAEYLRKRLAESLYTGGGSLPQLEEGEYGS